MFATKTSTLIISSNQNSMLKFNKNKISLENK